MAYQMRMVTSVRNNPLRRVFCLSVVVTGLVFWLAVPSSYAAPAKLLSYQGRVTDSNGQPPSNLAGGYNVRFRICDAATAGTCSTEDHTGAQGVVDAIPDKITVTNGLFSAVIGDTSDGGLDLGTVSFTVNRWLEVTVDSNNNGLGDDTAFSPRDRLTTAPYTISAVNTESCNADATCEAAALSTTGDATIGGRIDVNSTGSSFLGRVGVEGNAGIACNPATGSAGIWYADAGDCATVFVGINTATNGAEKWGIYLGSWDWTIDVNGNVWQGGNLSLDNTKYIEFAGNTLGADSSRLYTGASNRLLVRAEDTDNVAQFASYGLYLPLDPGVALYVGGDMRLGYASGTDNDVIQFDDGTKTLTWNDATGRFDFNADVTAPTFVGALSGNATTATNAYACSQDGTCETQAISATGAISTTSTITATGAISNSSTITTPGYVSITGVQDSSGNLRFSAANPYIYASSYFVAPGGAYFNSGTVYTEAELRVRGGIANDSANCSGYLCLNDQVYITDNNWIRVAADEGIYWESYGGGWYMSDSTWMRVYSNKYVYTGGVMRADAGFQVAGNNFCSRVGYSSASGDQCCPTNHVAVVFWNGNYESNLYNGTMLCCYGP